MLEYFKKFISGESRGIEDRKNYVTNAAGGLNPTSKFDLDRSEQHDLITLPSDVAGTNCSNCIYFDKSKYEGMTKVIPEHGYCHNSRLYGIRVNERMCCAEWNRSGSIRPWEA